MKKFLIIACLVCFTGNLQAEDCSKARKITEYKCRNVCDYVKGVGLYLKDTTCQVGDGIGLIFTAPFKSKFSLPEPRKYRYYHGSFKYCPPKIERIEVSQF